MPIQSKDLHGNVPDTADTVLLIIDMINDFNYPGGDKLQPKALEVANNIVNLKKELHESKIPTIYVNDNFGKWQSDFSKILEHAKEANPTSRKIVEILAPTKNDYFILKPKHSGFYETPLNLLLQYLQAKTLILSGLTTERCIMFTAGDAYLREYSLIIPPNCTNAIEQNDHEQALQLMKKTLRIKDV